MCGRFAVDIHLGVIEEVFELGDDHDAIELSPTWNAAPGTEQVVVRRGREGERRAARPRWGLVPHWADDPSIGNRLVNARSESAAEKPAFRDAFARHRCLIPATGFYEWDSRSGTRDPWFYVVDQGAPFAIGGVWSRWRDEEGDVLDTFCVLTTEANALTTAVHDRMPVLVDRGEYDRWLAPDTSSDALAAIMRPFDPQRMDGWMVSRDVNKPQNDGPELIRPERPAQGRLF